MIIGYQPGSGARRATVGALHVATFDGPVLRYAGSVGTGFGEAAAAMLREKLDGIAAPRCAVAGLNVKGAVWVAPDLQAEIAYRGVTTACELRHACFKGIAEV